MLELERLNVFRGPAQVLRNLSMAVADRESVCLVGRNGAGKTTTIDSIMGLLAIRSGRIVFGGRDITKLATHRRALSGIGYSPEDAGIFPDLTVAENVELPLTYREDMAASERKDRVARALERVGMSHRAKHFPAQLSGGQQQRVAVARAVAGDPLILLADEPTGNLDSVNGEAGMELLRELHRGGATICMVTHDPRYSAHADREIHLFDGRVVEERRGTVTTAV